MTTQWSAQVVLATLLKLVATKVHLAPPQRRFDVPVYRPARTAHGNIIERA